MRSRFCFCTICFLASPRVSLSLPTQLYVNQCPFSKLPEFVVGPSSLLQSLTRFFSHTVVSCAKDHPTRHTMIRRATHSWNWICKKLLPPCLEAP